MILRIYYIRSKVSIPIIKNFVSVKILKEKVNILSLEIEMQGELTVAKNEIYAYTL